MAYTSLVRLDGGIGTGVERSDEIHGEQEEQEQGSKNMYLMNIIFMYNTNSTELLALQHNEQLMNGLFLYLCREFFHHYYIGSIKESWPSIAKRDERALFFILLI
ncbi:hypothetical protein ACJX0J_020680 [Zea mays]